MAPTLGVDLAIQAKAQHNVNDPPDPRTLGLPYLVQHSSPWLGFESRYSALLQWHTLGIPNQGVRWVLVLAGHGVDLLGDHL